MKKPMIFAGPRGNVRVGWRESGWTYAEVIIQERRPFLLWTCWREVTDCPPSRGLDRTYMRSCLPDDLIRHYVDQLERWIRYDRAWSKFYQGQSIEQDRHRFKLIEAR